VTEQKQERPASLARRREPQPAPDETVDPVDTAPAKKAAPRKAPARKKPAVPPPPQALVPKGREVVFPLSTRVAEDVLKMLDRVTKTGVSQRAAVEHAIRHTYEHEYGHEGVKE
jgi:hypothetical protein